MANPFGRSTGAFFRAGPARRGHGTGCANRSDSPISTTSPAPYRNILVRVDFSAHSVRAVRRALDLAERHGGQQHCCMP